MRRALTLALLTALAGCVSAACASPGGPAASDAPCGIVDCSADGDDVVPDYAEPADFGKFDREGVEEAAREATLDGVLDAADVRELFDAAPVIVEILDDRAGQRYLTVE